MKKELSRYGYVCPYFEWQIRRIMRDINRIDEILKLLKTFWEKYPDLRLGQIISNATPNNMDVFYIEDDKIIEWLKENINK